MNKLYWPVAIAIRDGTIYRLTTSTPTDSLKEAKTMIQKWNEDGIYPNIAGWIISIQKNGKSKVIYFHVTDLPYYFSNWREIENYETK